MSNDTEKAVRYRRVHMTVDLVGGLQFPNRELRQMIVRDDGTHLTPQECRDLFVQKLREGFDVLPVCDNHDEKGHCLGHYEDPPAPSEAP